MGLKAACAWTRLIRSRMMMHLLAHKKKVSRRAVSITDTFRVGCLAGADEKDQGRRSPQQGKASQHCWQSGLAIDRPSRRIVDLHGAIGCKQLWLLSK